MSTRDNALILQPGEGRNYDCGQLNAVFKADEDETGCAYSVSEWWLEPNSPGPGAHSHDGNDDMFYVIEGTITFLIGDEWIPVSRGGFVRAAAGTTHDFRNDTDSRAGLLNFFVPGGFERDMPMIVQWYADNPAS
jgi:mannose-6-phosphate isomerase-like protein (cupin superfamily)